jgi:hypothetical protein
MLGLLHDRIAGEKAASVQAQMKLGLGLGSTMVGPVHVVGIG